METLSWSRSISASIVANQLVPFLVKPENPEIKELNDEKQVSKVMKLIRSRFEKVFPTYTETGYKLREVLYIPTTFCSIFLCGSGNIGKFISDQPICTINIPDTYLNKLALTQNNSVLISSASPIIFEVSIDPLEILKRIVSSVNSITLISTSEERLFGLSDTGIIELDLKERDPQSVVLFAGDFTTFQYSKKEWLFGAKSGTITHIDYQGSSFSNLLPGSINKLKYSRSEKLILALVGASMFILNKKLEIGKKYLLDSNPISVIMTKDEKFAILSTDSGKIVIIDIFSDQIITIPVHHGPIVSFFVDQKVENITTFGRDSKMARLIFPIHTDSRSMNAFLKNFVFYRENAEIIFIEKKIVKKWAILSDKIEDLHESNYEISKALHYIHSKDLLVFSDPKSIFMMRVLEKKISFKIELIREISITNVTSDIEGKHLFTLAGENNFIFVYEIQTGKIVSRMIGHESRINCQIHIKSSNYLATGSNDKAVIIWDYLHPKLYAKLLGHTSAVTSICTTRKANKIVSASKDLTIKIWLWRKKLLLISLNGHLTPIMTVIIDSNNNLTSISSDGVMIYWNLRVYAKVFKHNLNLETQNFIISANGAYMAYSDFDEMRVRLFPPFSRKLDVIGPAAQDKYEYMDYILRILKGEQVEFNQKWINWAIMPHQFNTLYIYSYTNLYRHIKLSIENGSSLVPSTLEDPFSLVTRKNYQRCLKVFFDSTKSLLHINQHSLSFLNQQVLIDLNYQGHAQLFKFYESIFNKHNTEDFPKFISKTLLPRMCLSKTFTPVFSNFFLAEAGHESNIDTNSTQKILNSITKITPTEKEGNDTLKVSYELFESDSEEEGNKNHKRNDNSRVPIVLYLSAVRMNFVNGSNESIDFVESLLGCPNKEIFKTKFIQAILTMKWKQLRKYEIMQAVVFFGYLFYLAAYILFLDKHEIGVIILVSVTGFMFLYDLIQLYKSFFLFWKDFRHYFDITRTICVILYSLAFYCEWSQTDHILIITVAVSAFRGVSYLRLFDDMRYITLLLRNVVKDMKSFAILMVYTTLTFSLILTIQDPISPYSRNLEIAYMLNIGDYHIENYDSVGWFIFIVMTVTNLIILLNMLIAIMGETFDKVRENSEVADFIEIAEMVLEIETFIGSSQADSNKYYLQLCEAESSYDKIVMVERDVKAIKNMLKKISSKLD